MDIEKISVDKESIERLINESYENCIKDINDAEVVFQMFFTKAGDEKGMGAERFGELLNNALKNKISSKDTLLKILSAITSRVKTQEYLNKGQNEDTAFFNNFKPEKMIDFLEEEDEKSKT